MRARAPLRGWFGIGAAAAAALLVAEGAVWLLRPRDVIQPVNVAQDSYFSSRQIERAESFRHGQRLLFVGTLAVEGGVLVALALGRPGGVRRVLNSAARHPVRGAVLAGAGLSLALVVVTLPLSAASHDRQVDAGLATQRFGAWLADAGRYAAVGALLAGAAAGTLVLLQRRFGRRWWIPASAVVIAFEVVFVWLAPVVLAPMFNKFQPLPAGATRSEVLDLARRADVDVGQVYRIDASRRSTALNAYVDGIGSSRRVVLYDNLLERTNERALRSVVAHELGHVADRDILRGLAFAAIVAPLGLLAAALVGERIARRGRAEPGTPAALPAYALALALTAFVLGVPGNQLSRKIEARADDFALRLTNDPQGLIELQQRLAVTNLAEPHPPGAIQFLLGTHPTTLQRIGAAVAYERDHQIGGGAAARAADRHARP